MTALNEPSPLYRCAEAAIAERDRLRESNQRLVAALAQCAGQFRMYQRQHEIAGKADKASVNGSFAIMCEAEIAKAEGK